MFDHRLNPKLRARLHSAGDFSLRIFVGMTLVFVHGAAKLPPPDDFVKSVNAMMFPYPLFFAWSAGIAEFLAGWLLALGLFTRPAALVVVALMIVAGFGHHGEQALENKELALVYLFIGIYYFLSGAGPLSIDAVASRRVTTSGLGNK